MKEVNINKAIGPDLVPNVILKNCADVLSKSITFLYNKSLELGCLPNKWKLANIVPVFKSGDKNNIINYRPVSLLSVVSKILERLIHTHIFDCIDQLISNKQYGFMPKRSTCIQLIETYNKIGKAMDLGKQVDVIYLDFSKAFDSVDHKLLLNKLKAYGITGKLFSWIENYLTNRQQRVVVNGETSVIKPVLSGVLILI